MIEINILTGALVGLIIFLFGIENFSSEIQSVAGERFKRILRKETSNKYRATFFGAWTTAILNSSTATTIITVGLINGGLISFAQSLGIIFGANIGSTITAQLIALRLTAFAPYLMVLGFLMSLFKKTKIIGKSFFFFGMVFFGLTLVSNSLAPLSNDPTIIKYFTSLSSVPLALMVGFLFTVIVNSSALTIGLIIVLASGGLISLFQGIPLLLGANLGTTTTTLIASAKMNLYAKRAAIAHLLFNVFGVLLILPFIEPYTHLISSIGGTIEQQIANAHTIFNILAAIIFLIFIEPFRKIVERLVRGNEEEILLRPKYLVGKLPETNQKAIELIEKEIGYLSKINLKMFLINRNLTGEIQDKAINQLKKMGILTNILSNTIEDSLFTLSQRKLSEIEAERVQLLIRISNSLEQLGDLAEDLGDLPEKVRSKGITPALDKSAGNLEKIYLELLDALKNFNEDFPEKSSLQNLMILSSKELYDWINKNYASQIKTFKKETYSSGSLFVETLSMIENSIFKLREILHLGERYARIRKGNPKHLNKIKN